MSVEDKINELLEQADALEGASDSVVLTTEDLDLLSEEEIAQLVENMDQLDEVSKATLAQYVGSQVETRDIDNAAADTAKIKAKTGNGDAAVLSNTAKTGEETKDRVISKSVSKEKGEQTEVAEEKVDLGNLFAGEELSEEFKAKAATIFEAAVATRVAQEVAAYKKELTEQNLTESAELKEGLIEKVDGYLSYVAEEWMNKNELALERGIKAELFESFMTGMQSLFKEHYVNVPEEQLDVLEDATNQIEELEAALNEATENNIAMSNTLKAISKDMQIEEASEGLSDVQAEKFRSLAEAIVYEDEETFGAKLDVIRENYFNETTPTLTESKVDFISDEPVQTLVEEVKTELSPTMRKYTQALG